MKKHLKKMLAGLFLFSLTAFILTDKAYAAGKVSITADKENAAVGDTLTVSVSADGGAGDTAPEISVTYDRNRLSFTSCSTEYGGGEGGLVTLTDTKAEIAFTILSGGTAEVTVDGEIDGETVSPASVSVSVEGEDTAAALGADASAGTGVEGGTISASDGSGMVSTVFADEFMPVLFHKTTTTYEEQMVEAAQFDMGDILLLYVTDEAGNNGTFKMYDQTTGQMSDFLSIQGIENRFIIVLKADETVTVPEGFTKASLQWNNDKMLEAYVMSNAVTQEGTSSSDFFLLYAISSEGNKGWYMYDQAEGTYQRYINTGANTGSGDEEGGFLSSLTGDQDTSDEGLTTKDIIMIVMGALLLIFLVLMIIMFVKLRDYQSYEYIDEDDEEAYEEYVRGQENTPAARGNDYAADDIENLENDDNITMRAKASDEEPEDDDEDYPRAGGKLTAGDLVRRHMSDEEPEDEDDEDYFTPRKLSREEKKQEKARLKAEKKARKKLEREYGENGPVDWSEFENTVKESLEDERRPRGNNAESMPPAYRDAQRGEPVYQQQPVFTDGARGQYNVPQQAPPMQQRPMQQQPMRQPVQQPVQQPMGQPMQQSMRQPIQQPVRQPIQEEPVQQFQQPAPPAYNPADLDEDFDFEFLNIES